MNPETRCAIAADHPSLAGHFPGNPIVPGVVILEEVARAFEAWRPTERPVGMPVVKFLAPLRPGQAFTIRFAQSGARGVRFECIRDDGRALAQGCLTVARIED
jgi:3-hydroxymyristoyl/3-hydroxydecanoyl-(acyl carrier protein) dehydratase